MRAGIATVHTPRAWEGELVQAARVTGLARVVRRCLRPVEVEMTLASVDIVVIGGETPWLSEYLVKAWRHTGTVVVGMVPPGDGPSRVLFERAGCDLVLDQGQPAVQVLTAVLGLVVDATPADRGEVITVVGPRGAPGRSEMALGIAWLLSRRQPTLLVELDTEAPSLGLRLGLCPHLGLAAADPAVGEPVYRQKARLSVVTLPPSVGSPGRSSVTRVLEAARAHFASVVMDPGPVDPASLDFRSAVVAMVVDPAPAGIVRAGRALAGWRADPPLVIINRLSPGDEVALRSVRAATGLDPVAVVPEVSGLAWGSPPPAKILQALRPAVTAFAQSAAR